MPLIEEPSIDFRYTNTMEDEFELPLFCDDISSVKSNQHIRQINSTYWSVILRDHVRKVNLDLLLLCQVVFINCVGVFYSCKTWPNNKTFVVKPFQQMCPGIVLCPIVERTTIALFQILFGHQWTSTKAIWARLGNCRIPMILSSDRSGNVEKPIIHK